MMHLPAWVDRLGWIAPAAVLFALELACLHFHVYRRNLCFSLWLGLGLLVELGFAQAAATWGLKVAAGFGAEPASLLARIDAWAELAALLLAVAAVIEAMARRSEPYNRSIALWLGLMIALDVAILVIHDPLGFSAYLVAWLRNAAFYIPAVALLFAICKINPFEMIGAIGSSLGAGHSPLLFTRSAVTANPPSDTPLSLPAIALPPTVPGAARPRAASGNAEVHHGN